MHTNWKNAAFAAMLTLLPATAAAYDLPPVNLGLTSFLDGGPPAGPGLYFQQYLMYYTADEFKDGNGDSLPLPFSDPDLDSWVSLSQFIYQSDRELLSGARMGMNVIVPYAGLDMSPYHPALADNGSGLGDIVLGPFLQWDPVMGENGPRFLQRVELQFILPTGEYDNTKAINPGSNFFSFNPYWAATLFLTPRWTASWRLHYLWNDTNDDPAPGLDSVQAGQAVHANLSTALEVVEKRLRLGLNAYYLKQLTETEANGVDRSDSKEQVLGIGPGGVYHFSPDNHIFVNLYFESAAENRTEGERFNVRWVHHF